MWLGIFLCGSLSYENIYVMFDIGIIICYCLLLYLKVVGGGWDYRLIWEWGIIWCWGIYVMDWVVVVYVVL